MTLAMRLVGPREALWHAIVRKNYGCTHFIVGRNHAGPGFDSSRRPFYEPYAAQEALRLHQAELGITLVPFRNMVYIPDWDQYVPEDEVPPGAHALNISGTDLRRLINQGEEIPARFTFPEVARELKRTYGGENRRGICSFRFRAPASAVWRMC